MILDSNEQPVNARTAFALSIQFQKNEILSALHCSDVEYDGAKILWVVTAWNDSEVVKLFMREAALRVSHTFVILYHMVLPRIPKQDLFFSVRKQSPERVT